MNKNTQIPKDPITRRLLAFWVLGCLGICGGAAAVFTPSVNPSGTVVAPTNLNFSRTIWFNSKAHAGWVPNQLTTVERDALTVVTNGTWIYNTTDGKIQFRQGNAWIDLVGGTGIGPVAANMTALAALNPITNGVVTLLGYYSPFDGGGGKFYGTNSIAGTNPGTRIFTPFSASWQRLDDGSLNVRSFGARGNGTSNDTPAFTAYYDAIKTNGGTIFVPNPTNAFLVNLTITNSGIRIEGENGDVVTSTNGVLRPWDVTRPVIQVGNDTGWVKKFSMHRISIYADRGGTNCPGAVHLLGGTEKARITECAFIGGADTIKLMGGATFPSTLSRFEMCEAWEGTNATINAIYPAAGSYTTGNSYQGHVNGHNTSGYTVRVDKGTPITFDTTYLDMPADRGVYMTNSPQIRAQNSNFDNNGGTGLFILDSRPAAMADRDFSHYVEGDGNDFQGGLTFWDNTSTNPYTIPGNGWHGVSRYGLHFQPRILTFMDFATIQDPQFSAFTMSIGGTNATDPLTFYRTDLQDPIFDWYGSVLRFRHRGDTNIANLWAFDFPLSNTNVAGIEFFRETTRTNSLYMDLHQGTGAFARQTRLSANGDSWINSLVGNVGIGTQNPAEKLDVRGSGTFSNSLTANVVRGTNGLHTAGPLIGYSPEVNIYGTAPGIFFDETDAAANNRKWDIYPLNSVLNFRFIDDAIATMPWMSVWRTGLAGTAIETFTLNFYIYTNLVVGNRITLAGNDIWGLTPGANVTFSTNTGTKVLTINSTGGGGGGGGSGSLQNATVTGSGTDYTITDTYARVDFGAGDPTHTLPAAGTYLLIAHFSQESANTFVKRFKFRDTTASADVAGSEILEDYSGGGHPSEVAIHAVYTSPGANTVQLWAQMNDPSYTGTHVVWSTNCTFSYVRLDGVLGLSVNAAAVATPNLRDVAGTGTVPAATLATSGTNIDLTIGPASGTVAGVVTTGTQSFDGTKTFLDSVNVTNAVNAYSLKVTNSADIDGPLSLGAIASVEADLNAKALASHVHAFSILTTGTNSALMAGNFRDAFTRKSQAGTLSGATPTVDWQTEPLKFHIVSAPITYGEANRPTSSTAGESLEIHMTNSTGSDQPIVLPSGWRDETGVGFTNLVAGKTATIYSKWNSAEVKFYWRTYEPP